MKYMLDDMNCESLYLYSTEELHPNSQGCIGKKATQISLTLQVLKQQEGFIQQKFLHLWIINNLHWEAAFCWTRDLLIRKWSRWMIHIFFLFRDKKNNRLTEFRTFYCQTEACISSILPTLKI